jgi:hypothetical protein
MVRKHDIMKRLSEIDKYGLTTEIDEKISIEDIQSFSENYIKQEIKSVLGLDIYKYSDYNDEKQVLIPFIFDSLLDNAISCALEEESFLFKTIDIRKYFISTGDGGFIIFPTPLHSLVFNLIFFFFLYIFNSGRFFPKLSKYMGEIAIRSTITYDKVFSYENNWYGKAIIKNARILSKDKLNRFIIDKETHAYFMKIFNGIESLSITDNKTIKQILNLDGELDSHIFNSGIRKILNIHIQKIEDILAKSTYLNIYNVEIQSHIKYEIHDDTTLSYVYTLGNANIVNI